MKGERRDREREGREREAERRGLGEGKMIFFKRERKKLVEEAE